MALIGVGIDWGSQEHEVCIVDEQYRELRRLRIAHDGESIAKLAAELQAFVARGDQVRVGIERPDGALVETLLEQGLSVFAINPLQLDRFRERYKPSGAKDDRADAWVAARTVLTDVDCFRELRIADPRYVALREWSRMREERVADRTRVLNRLTDLLRRFFPAILEIGRVDEAWVHALLRTAPTPQRASALSKRSVTAMLKRHRIRRIDATAVLGALARPALRVESGHQAVLAEQVLLLIDQVQLLERQIEHCESCLEQLLHALRSSADGAPSDAEILNSLPGVGTVVLATLLAESSDAIATRDLARMRALTGVAPVSILSGKRQNRFHDRKPPRVERRRACSSRLSSAMYHCARAAAVFSEPHKQRYAAMRARGHTHGRACRQLADQILTVAFAMLRNRTLYRPPLAA